MATTFRLCVSCPSELAGLADRVLAQAHRLITTLELELTEFRPESPIHALNEAAPTKKIRMSDSALELLVLSEAIRQQTLGAFDCTAKSQGALQGRRIDWDGVYAWRLDEGARLGFGAIGKGYALDKVRELLVRHGFEDFRLSAGGSSIILSGFAAPREPWSWGWSWKKDKDGSPLGTSFAHLTGASVALGVSGTHEKGDHLIDPRTGAPKATLKSALVCHPSAACADALSTALFISGWEEMIHPPLDCAMAVIDHDEVPRWNGPFQRYFSFPRTESAQ